MAGGELSAVFKGLAGDAAKAGEDIGNSIARFTEKTADIEEENVARTLAADSDNARALQGIKPNVGSLESDAGADGTAGAGGSGGRISSLLDGEDGAGSAGSGAGGGSGLPGAAHDDPAAADAPSGRPTAGDPVDVGTGDVVMSQVDVSLAGVLPLVLERTHRSSHRTGRWLGKSWMSSFDQRLEVIGDRVHGAFADGRVLTWNLADSDSGSDSAEDVLPEDGPCWLLRRVEADAYVVTDPQQGLTWRFERLAGHWTSGYRDLGGLPLVSITDRAGHVVRHDYDEAGRPASVSHSGGYRVAVTVEDGRIASMALGGVTLVSYSYDEDGQLTGVVNSSGRALRFTYDYAGRLTGWTDRNDQSYAYSYDSAGRCVEGRSPSGALSGTFSYEDGVTRWTDGAGAVTTYEIDSSAQVSAITDPLGAVTLYERDARGRVLSETDPLRRETRYAYDDLGNLVSVTRADGQVAWAEYDELGQARVVREFGRGVWRQGFDDLGNRTSVTQPDGTSILYAYDDAGHLAAVTAADGAVTRVTCDALGLPVAVVEPGGAQTRYERDQFGRIIRVTGPDGGVTSMSWTTEGRPVSRTLPDGSVESWTWDGEGNLVQHLSPAGAVTAFEYEAFDKTTAAVWPDGTRTAFAYDHEQRVTSVTHGGLTWRYTYDAAGRLLAETDYNGAVTSYSFDVAGQMVRQVNATGQSVAYSYDAVGNLVSSVASDTGAETSFSYDEAGLLVRAANASADMVFERDALGRVTAETCDGRTVSTSYDAAGRTVSRVTPSGLTASWSYDAAGLPAVLTSGGREVRFGYDAAGREISRALPGGVTLRQDWDPVGRLTAQVIAGSGASGAPGRPGPEGPVTPGQLLQRREYVYNPDGFVTGVTDLLSGSRAFGLDSSGRVTGATGPQWAERYSYDSMGNVTSASWPAMPPSAAGGWLDAEPQGAREVSGTLIRRAGNVSYRYDAAGRVIRRTRTRISRKPETWTYSWDADSRLALVTVPDGSTWRYSYDPLGRRVLKEHVSASGQTLASTRFTWDGLVLAEQASTGPADDADPNVITWDYQPGTFAPVAQTASSPRQPGDPSLRNAPQDVIDQRFYSIVTDLIGTPSELVAADGTLAGRQQQTLWGGTAWESSGTSTPLRFPGQYADDETGLHYNNQRYYDPVTGAYLSPDPLGLTPAPNPHAYVPNPRSSTDPLGLVSCKGDEPPGEFPSRRAAFRAAKRDLGIPMGQHPDSVESVNMTDKWGKNILDGNGRVIKTREYNFTQNDGQRIIIQEHSAGHWYGEGDPGNQGPHFNVRPITNPRTGKVPGTLSHYPFPR